MDDQIKTEKDYAGMTFIEAAMDTVVNEEVGALNLRVRDVVSIAEWLDPTVRALLAQAWDEGHGTSNGGCVYWPDCAEIGDHVNPYREPSDNPTPPGERT